MAIKHGYLMKHSLVVWELCLDASPGLFECRHEKLIANEPQIVITYFSWFHARRGGSYLEDQGKMITSRCTPTWLPWGALSQPASGELNGNVMCGISSGESKTSYPLASGKHCLFSWD